MDFKHTNFRMPNGKYTISEKEALFDLTNPILLGIESVLDKIIGCRTFVDYGCYEGGYCVSLAFKGYEGLGIDARKENIDRCVYLRDAFEIGKDLTFAITDLNDFYLNYLPDISLCLGLLYHLENPHRFIKMMAKTTKYILFLHTHYATTKKPYQPKRLGEMCEHEGLMGRWYTEHPENASEDEIEASLKSSYGNRKSFWIEKNNLIYALKEAGFKLVLEQHDWIDDPRTNRYVEDLDRNMFICIK